MPPPGVFGLWLTPRRTRLPSCAVRRIPSSGPSPTRIARNVELRLAYQVFGEGADGFHLRPGFACNLEGNCRCSVSTRPRGELAPHVASRLGVVSMTTQADAQTNAAAAAAKAREVLAERIAKLTPRVEEDDQAKVVLHLAEAYGHLAVEPPRTRAT